MAIDLDEVTASYHRCRANDGFIDTFYDVFLSKSPEIAYKFRNTDFKRQKLMLRESLLMMLLFNLDADATREEAERLGIRHGRGGADIPPHMYRLWLDSLCEAVQIHDPEYQPDLDDMWRKAMQPGIDLIQSHY